MSHLPKENNQTLVCTLDTTLEKIQKKNTDVLGPLSKYGMPLKVLLLLQMMRLI